MKVSISQQIDEIDRELGQRANVYPRLVMSGKLRQSVADFQNDRLKAARASLARLQENEDAVRNAVKGERP